MDQHDDFHIRMKLPKQGNPLVYMFDFYFYFYFIIIIIFFFWSNEATLI
jgi:hypothetical protein